MNRRRVMAIPKPVLSSDPTLRLQQLLLAWDYFDLDERLTNEQGALQQELKAVPATFNDMQDYIDTFEPLLLEECGSLLVRGSEEGIASAAEHAISSELSQKGDFLQVKVTMHGHATARFSDNDMVLLCLQNPGRDVSEEPSEPGGVREEKSRLHALGYVDSHQGTQSLMVKFFLQPGMYSDEPSRHRVQAIHALLKQPNRVWWVQKLSNMSTITREWVALHSVRNISFPHVLLKGHSAAALGTSKPAIPEVLHASLREQYNESQVAAVVAGMTGAPVVLIQGPPGTGKTKTILALLSLILYAKPSSQKSGQNGAAAELSVTQAPSQIELQRLWKAASPWITGDNPRDLVKPWHGTDKPSWMDAYGLLDQAPLQPVGSHSNERTHVLVCAPSNSALDEIVLRLTSDGVMDESGQYVTPRIVRVGVQAHHSVDSVTLETLVERKLATSADLRGERAANKSERDRAKAAVLEEAQIVCSTLSFSGSRSFAQMKRKFDVVVIDEAAQAVEPSVLIPICQGVKQAYLVGDPIQLPATVLSKRATTFGYDVSLFKRLQSAGYPVQMLDTQYRMHPDICEFPSLQFYNGNIKTGEGVLGQTTKKWHKDKVFGPFTFYDVPGKESIPENASSYVNLVEVEMVLNVYTLLVTRHPQLRNKSDVAVISPYKAQVKLLREKFKMALGDEMAKMVDINTIDGFQGREKDIAIFSTVRSRKGGGIGFVADERRINVGLTRARSSLIVIGNAFALQRDARWSALTQQASRKGCLYKPTKPFKEFLENVVAGRQRPAVLEEPEKAEDFVPQAEPDAYEDDECFSDYEDVPMYKPHHEHGKRPIAQPAAQPAAKRARKASRSVR